MPEKGSLISFIHHNRSIKVPFVVYVDFEAFLEEISTCEPNEKKEFYETISDTDRVDFVIKLSALMKNYSISSLQSKGWRRRYRQKIN